MLVYSLYCSFRFPDQRFILNLINYKTNFDIRYRRNYNVLIILKNIF